MIAHEKKFIEYLEHKNVGGKDKVADSRKSYVSYLKSVSKCYNNVDINKSFVDSRETAEQIYNNLLSKAEGKADSTLKKWKTALIRYAEFSQSSFYPKDEIVEKVSSKNKISQSEILHCAKANSIEYSTSSDMKELERLWKEYLTAFENIYKSEFLQTGNVVGEVGEYLAAKQFNGTLEKPSNASHDFTDPQSKRYQVKARKLNGSGKSTSLGVIRSSEFDVLVIVIFNKDGSLYKFVTLEKDAALGKSVRNELMNGSVITVSQKFFALPYINDLTEEVRKHWY